MCKLKISFQQYDDDQFLRVGNKRLAKKRDCKYLVQQLDVLYTIYKRNEELISFEHFKFVRDAISNLRDEYEDVFNWVKDNTFGFYHLNELNSRQTQPNSEPHKDDKPANTGQVEPPNNETGGNKLFQGKNNKSNKNK